MKTIKSYSLKHLILSLLGVVIYAINPLYSQNQDGVLWKITGKGIQTSYLFGTVHIVCDSNYRSNMKISQAMQATDVVAMELNLGDYEVLIAMMKASMEKSNTSISKLVNAEDYKLIDSVCQTLLGVALKDMEQYTCMNLMSKFYASSKILGCSSPQSVDFQLTEMAQLLGKETFGLETFSFQDSLMKTIPDSMQAKWLLEFCKDIPKAKEELQKLLTLYKTQSTIKLYSLIVSSPEMEYLKESLLIQRNIEWLGFLKDNLPNLPIFMAVGIGHLGGETGLIQGLRNAGYTLVPIKI